MKQITILLLLAVLAAVDIKRKSISIMELTSFYTVCIVLALITDCNWQRLYVGLIITGGFLVFCIASGMMGKADAIVIGGVTTATGLTKGIQMFLVGITLMSFYSIVLLIRKKVRVKSEVPFVPFLCLAWLGVLICG